MEKTHRQPMLLEGTMDLIIIIIIILQLDDNSFLPLEKYRFSKHDAENISRSRQVQHLHQAYGT